MPGKAESWLAERGARRAIGPFNGAAFHGLGNADRRLRRGTGLSLPVAAALRAVVVLDNCEHLLRACAEVTEAVLRSCPGVAVITTSRAPLGVPGETDWRVPSLSLPSPERESLEGPGQVDAVRLFIERARKARPNFAVTSDNAPAVAQVWMPQL